jgi:hypothetical protein
MAGAPATRAGPRTSGGSSLTGDAGDGETVELRFGEQLHTRVLAGARDGDRDLCPEQVAAYVAKFSCKSSHEQITTRDTEPDGWRDRGVPEQLVRLAYGVLRLSGRAGLRGLVGWMHMLGFRGHFVTKSTSLGTLRAARAAYRAIIGFRSSRCGVACGFVWGGFGVADRALGGASGRCGYGGCGRVRR